MATTNSKSRFKPEDIRLLNRWYGTLYKADVVFKSIAHTRQEEKRAAENHLQFFKRFGKWLQD